MKRLLIRSNTYTYLIIASLVIGLLSICSACTPATEEPAATATSQPEESEVPDSPVPPMDTAVLNTSTPTPIPSATPLPTLTSTPLPIINITGNTNCRSGPGSVYDLLHTYMTGDQARLQGISPDGFFWYTSGVEAFLPECWLWNHYTTPVGDTSGLPVLTPPPTPTPNPDFEITFANADVAAGSWYFFFEIENTGSVAWESALLYIYDPVVPQDAGRFSNYFQVNDHSDTPTTDNIPVGGSAYFHAARLSNPGGYGKTPGVVDVYFIACTQEYLGGFCMTRMWSDKYW